MSQNGPVILILPNKVWYDNGKSNCQGNKKIFGCIQIPVFGNQQGNRKSGIEEKNGIFI